VHLNLNSHTISEVAATTAYGERWIEQLLARYNAEGSDALGDLRRRNGALPTILKPELLAKPSDRLREPPPDGGLWSSRKVDRLDGRRARPHIGRAAAWLGRVEGDRLCQFRKFAPLPEWLDYRFYHSPFRLLLEFILDVLHPRHSLISRVKCVVDQS
jgi:hypothetical protein